MTCVDEGLRQVILVGRGLWEGVDGERYIMAKNCSATAEVMAPMSLVARQV